MCEPVSCILFYWSICLFIATIPCCLSYYSFPPPKIIYLFWLLRSSIAVCGLSSCDDRPTTLQCSVGFSYNGFSQGLRARGVFGSCGTKGLIALQHLSSDQRLNQCLLLWVDSYPLCHQEVL